jgi:hypothetical protein
MRTSSTSSTRAGISRCSPTPHGSGSSCGRCRPTRSSCSMKSSASLRSSHSARSVLRVLASDGVSDSGVGGGLCMDLLHQRPMPRRFWRANEFVPKGVEALQSGVHVIARIYSIHGTHANGVRAWSRAHRGGAERARPRKAVVEGSSVADRQGRGQVCLDGCQAWRRSTCWPEASSPALGRDGSAVDRATHIS